MQRSVFQRSLILSLIFAGICLTNAAFAGKTDWADGPASPRHRFVRVAQDILLISIGTGMVVDAFEDIGR